MERKVRLFLVEYLLKKDHTHISRLKKVRRVKKHTQAQPGDQVEIITRPDGTKVRRIRRVKKPEGSNSTTSGNDISLDSHLSRSSAKKGSSASVAGDMVEGEIYVRADGKK